MLPWHSLSRIISPVLDTKQVPCHTHSLLIQGLLHQIVFCHTVLTCNVFDILPCRALPGSPLVRWNSIYRHPLLILTLYTISKCTLTMYTLTLCTIRQCTLPPCLLSHRTLSGSSVTRPIHCCILSTATLFTSGVVSYNILSVVHYHMVGCNTSCYYMMC